MAVAGALDSARVVQVFAPVGDEGLGRKGAGYLVDSDVVLTARHVVQDATAACEVRRLGDARAFASRVEWSGQGGFDAAVLRIVDDEWPRPEMEPVRFGRLVSDARTACEALGFPWAQTDRRDSGAISRTERMQGDIDPLSGIQLGGRHELLDIHVAGSVPERRTDGGSPWAGMSGAALFSGPLLVGVVSVDPDRYGPDRLLAVPVSTLAHDPSFHSALTRDAKARVAVSAVEAQGVLSDPYRPLPARRPASAEEQSRPSVLLDWRSAVVPFRGREAELAQLRDWCASGTGLALGLITGIGGTGKTRLAAELCSRQQHAGAVAGFFAATVAPERVEALIGRAPVLIVLDEANIRIEQLRTITQLLSARYARVPVRLLLLARDDGEWRERLADDLRDDDPDAADAVEGVLRVGLGAVDATPATRREAFHDATRAFAAALGRETPPVVEPDFSAGVFEAILFVHLAALAAVEGELEHRPDRVPPTGLVEFALGREARYWSRTAAARGLDVERQVLERAVAVATMTIANSEDAAARALRAIPDIADAPGSARPIARWLHDLYRPAAVPAGLYSLAPEDEAEELWFRPLMPDLLGERLVAVVVRAVPSLPARLVSDATPDQVKRTLAVLTNTARVDASAREPLRQSLCRALEQDWPIILEVAQESGDPIGQMLAEALEARPNPRLAAEIEAKLPERSVALREAAVVITQQAIELALETDQHDDRDVQVARLKRRLSRRLGEAGEDQEALRVAHEAVALYRGLDHDDDRLLAELSDSLNTLAVRLGTVNRPEEALVAAREGVELRRVLAEKDEATYGSDLAESLATYAVRLGKLQRHEEAIHAVEEAVATRRRHGDAHDDPDARAKLATTLSTLGARLGALGRHEEALAATEESVAIRRELARAGGEPFAPELARALSNLAVRLGKAGRFRDSLAVAEEAVAIRRKLASIRPTAFEPGLAISLVEMSLRLRDLARCDEALIPAEEAVEIRRRLVALKGDAQFGVPLARALRSYSARLLAVGRQETAIVAAEEAVEITERLAQRDPQMSSEMAKSERALARARGGP